MSLNVARSGRAAGAVVLAVTLAGAGWWVTGAHAESTPAAQATTPAPSPAAGRFAVPSYADAVARVAPAVVTVHVEKKAEAEPTSAPDEMLRRFFGQDTPSPERQPRERGLGSGVIVTSTGHVLTNAHVVDGADKVRVILQDGREFDGKVLGVDKASDLAVIDIKASNLPIVPLGDSSATRVGDVVLAVGNPLGVGETVTMGILSAKGRTTSVGSDGAYEDFLQTDAPINRGNSGGALVTASGELIGITSQILSPSGGNIGIGFAIPSNMAKNVMDQLVSTGHVRRAMLGVTVQPVTGDIAQSLRLPDVHGAIVSDVNADSPAARAGMKAGDVITAVNGTSVQGANELRNLVSSLTPGTKATLTVVRDGRTDALTVTPSERESASASRETGAPEAGTLGLTVEPLTPRLADRLKVPQSTEGVVVNNVDPDGAAAAAGLEPGDVIRQADGKSVRTADDLRAVAHAKSDRPALLLVQRGDRSFFTAIDRSQG